MQAIDLYAVLVVIIISESLRLMLEIVKEYVGELVRLVNEMAPYLLLGFFFAGILRVVFPKAYYYQIHGEAKLQIGVECITAGSSYATLFLRSIAHRDRVL